jgi:hypothetical protein
MINRRRLFSALAGVPAAAVPGKPLVGPSNGCEYGLGTMWIAAQVGEFRGGVIRAICDHCKKPRKGSG